MEEILTVRNLGVSYQLHARKAQIIRGVNFELKSQEIIGVVGESGCGKSITMQALLKLIPSPPGEITSGEVLYQGQDLLKKSETELLSYRGLQIGMVFQDSFSSLNPTMKIGEQIIEPMLAHRLYCRPLAKKRVLELLELTQVDEPEIRFEQYPHQLSGGMRQRVMIALALSCNPKILIADEPTTALDVTVQAQILDLLQKVRNELKTSIILVTHDLGVVAHLCDRVLVMYAGKIVEQGTVEQVLLFPKHPYTQLLLQSVPRYSSLAQKLLTLEGTPPSLYSLQEECPFVQRCPYALKICSRKAPPRKKYDDKHFASCWLDTKEDTNL